MLVLAKQQYQYKQVHKNSDTEFKHSHIHTPLPHAHTSIRSWICGLEFNTLGETYQLCNIIEQSWINFPMPIMACQ